MRWPVYLLLALLLALAGCDNMANQPKRKAYAVPYGEPVHWPPLPPHGIVARNEKLKPPGPPPVTLALLQRGQQRFNIYCSPCHGRDGHANGMVVQRGFPQPPSYFEKRLEEAPNQHFYDVITHGWGVMYPYAERVAPSDRWAIIAYIRALQASEKATIADVPPVYRAALK
ncbi:MAG TPA: cytochrome c [Stellaceae bacterium]|nr:cytochrome c [Stellaceae bacterium]